MNASREQVLEHLRRDLLGLQQLFGLGHRTPSWARRGSVEAPILAHAGEFERGRLAPAPDGVLRRVVDQLVDHVGSIVLRREGQVRGVGGEGRRCPRCVRLFWLLPVAARCDPALFAVSARVDGDAVLKNPSQVCGSALGIAASAGAIAVALPLSRLHDAAGCTAGRLRVSLATTCRIGRRRCRCRC